VYLINSVSNVLMDENKPRTIHLLYPCALFVIFSMSLHGLHIVLQSAFGPPFKLMLVSMSQTWQERRSGRKRGKRDVTKC
jgi:hypothetical protein